MFWFKNEILLQLAFLQVVIPPDFILEETTSDVMVSEGGTVRLTCNATGEPTPSIHWKRDHNHNITLKTPQGAKTYGKHFYTFSTFLLSPPLTLAAFTFL